VPLSGTIRHIQVFEPWEWVQNTDRGALPEIVKQAIALDDLDDAKFMWGAGAVVTQCMHRVQPIDDPGWVCAAFPGQIPSEIRANHYDHRKPWIDPDTAKPGDEGVPLAGSIRFAPKPGTPRHRT
jgi:hypothetical protein